MSSAFGGPPSPLPVKTSYVHAPLTSRWSVTSVALRKLNQHVGYRVRAWILHKRKMTAPFLATCGPNLSLCRRRLLSRLIRLASRYKTKSSNDGTERRMSATRAHKLNGTRRPLRLRWLGFCPSITAYSI